MIGKTVEKYTITHCECRIWFTDNTYITVEAYVNPNIITPTPAIMLSQRP